MGVLDGLSLPPRTLVRLDNLYIPFNSEYPAPIPRSLNELLGGITTMQLAVDKEMLFLVVEGESPESGLWLRVRHEANTFWSHWLSGLHVIMVPLGNLTSLHIDLYDPFVLTVLSQLSDLFVLLEPDKVAEERVRINALVPRVATFCSVLSQSQPMACPSLRSLVLEWRRDTLTYLEDLGVPDIFAMLSSRASFGHPIRRLVIQAIPASGAESGSTLQSHFSEQLSPLAGHVEEFEECVDGDAHVCAFKMQEMWNVTGAEDYWCVNERQRPRYIPLWSYDYSFTS
ncbi:hypothetical protein GSI_09995 [Ganoderma sinense ZZ0214-1]|uniref:Uncharacterized protein n=1 Tax=Ganoderma sinense ZZ0214-1 TaxID=1077348 RepID=A0A2G8S268_9APHY|nr:hypothetical protein GSI_09995 [Ganoderma sinense ZZ0214-1]